LITEAIALGKTTDQITKATVIEAETQKIRGSKALSFTLLFSMTVTSLSLRFSFVGHSLEALAISQILLKNGMEQHRSKKQSPALPKSKLKKLLLSHIP